MSPSSLYFTEVKFVVLNLEAESSFVEIETKSANDIVLSQPVITDIRFNSATVTWDNDGNVVDGYRVTYGRLGTPLDDMKQIELTYYDDTIVDLTDLDEDTTYTVIISVRGQQNHISS